MEQPFLQQRGEPIWMCVAAMATPKRAARSPGEMLLAAPAPKTLLQQRGDSRALRARNWLLGGSIRSAFIHSSFVFETYTEVFYRAEGYVLSVKVTRSCRVGSSWADSVLRPWRAVLCSALSGSPALPTVPRTLPAPIPLSPLSLQAHGPSFRTNRCMSSCLPIFLFLSPLFRTLFPRKRHDSHLPSFKPLLRAALQESPLATLPQYQLSQHISLLLPDLFFSPYPLLQHSLS